MKLDSISDTDLISQTEVLSGSQRMIWLYPVIGILCAGFIFLLIRKYRRHCIERKILKGERIAPDFDNVINNAFHAQELYNDLKGLCHPDKFATNPALCEKATEIFSLLVKNKHNYHELLRIRERIEQELKIKIQK